MTLYQRCMAGREEGEGELEERGGRPGGEEGEASRRVEEEGGRGTRHGEGTPKPGEAQGRGILE